MLRQLLRRIEEHIVNYSLAEFPLILHGGETLLWGVENFYRIAEACEGISARTGCQIPIAVTTNGVLIDEIWVDCFKVAAPWLKPSSSQAVAPRDQARRRPRSTKHKLGRSETAN